MSGPERWDTGPGVQSLRPLQHCQEGRTLSWVVPLCPFPFPGPRLSLESPGEAASPSFPETLVWGWASAPCGPSLPSLLAHLREFSDYPQMGHLNCSSNPPLSVPQPGVQLPPSGQAPPRDSNRSHCIRCVGLCLREGGTGQGMAQPKQGRGGGKGRAAFPAPSAPAQAPASAGSTTDLIRQLQQPAGARCPPAGPPTSGRVRGDSPGLPAPPGRWGRPSLPSPPLPRPEL